MTFAPNGQWLELSGLKGRLMGPWGFMAELSGPAGPIRLHTAALGSLEATENYLGTLHTYLRREISTGSARIVALETTEPALTTFLWQGPYHEVSMTLGGTKVPFETFLETLLVLEIDDRRAGVVLRPRAGSGAAVRLLLGANTVVGVCAVSVTPIEAMRQGLPGHPGRAVAGGVLWQQTEQSAADPIRRAIVANGTAATILETDRPDDAAFVEVVSALSIDLAAAA